MPTSAHLHLFSILDLIALGFLFFSWVAVGWWIERDSPKNRSVSVMMSEHRRTWMREMVQRDTRIFDSQVAASLRQGTSFLASTSILCLGAVVAVMGAPDPLIKAAEAVGRDAPGFLWQVKLLLVALFLTVAFLRFVWSNRLFGYTVVLMAAVPNDKDHPEANPRAAQAAEMNIRAAVNFNRGLRAMYFAIGALTWLAGAAPLMAATAVTVWIIWQREFFSQPQRILSQGVTPKSE